ncbi:TPA: hypothetical protein ACNH9H_005340 [Pseudomonas aeruginosa]
MQTQTWIALCATLISATALFFSMRSFREVNRPIITAEIKTHSGGNIAIAYSLHVYNVGNRPACKIRLHAKEKLIRNLISSNPPEKKHKEIFRCFSEKGLIPILHPGCEKKNAFGATSSQPEQNTINYGFTLPVKISYRDLNNRKYTSHLVLLVKDSDSFAGSTWN